jgi:cyclohexa-1,5-dienecarbonyl-CoA hydratase
MGEGKLRVQRERNGAVVRLVLNAPPGNILDIEMIDAIRAAAAHAAAEVGVKAIVLEGAGEHFSYGASVPEHRAGEVERALPRFHDLFRDLLDLGRPMLAVVRGRCLGGGLELALASNWIFADPRAELGLPEIRLGVFPPAGSLLLPGRVGRAMAETMCLTGCTLAADEALECGLVDFVAEEPGTAADAWIADNLLPHSATALHYAVRAGRAPLRDDLHRGLEELERLYLRDLMRTDDAREGIAAFLEKRAPQWKDR